MRCAELVEVSVLKFLSNEEKAIFRGYLMYDIFNFFYFNKQQLNING